MTKLKNIDIQPVTIGEAPEGSKKTLEQTKESLGFVPNMYGVMGNSPALLNSYAAAYTSFREQTGFSAVEQEVVLLSVSYKNECNYCMAAHSMVADKMSGVPAEVTEALRKGNEIPDAKLQALSVFTKAMVEKRGWPSEEDVSAFLDAGYEQNQIFDVITGIGVKIFSNYSNHVATTEVDDAFASYKWSK